MRKPLTQGMLGLAVRAPVQASKTTFPEREIIYTK